ncbi:replicative DNA helicase [Enterobacteriaceae bacterium ET-AT1-13]|nr:replicative DNA helicase [Enterobacteriaceae bacterium ET-AT1-13]WGS66367.1 replicative DNA helicase [Enterobacteriaceae bacterium Cmel17]WMC17392.1 MAG: replicative DNA helicase [Enterobacteriaceae bacterium Cmel21]WMC17598.1 MAG: replicative DNA helicase [Enterobacteriaceae bacterium PSmelAO3-2]WMC17803.1 MAG: replicative DNA helicase [Enterobacteriaceae bacterium PSmelAO3-1]WMC18006.1 MAG: replicative DNA helicase [Enterobacteriaceae bacterium PSmelAO1]
MLNNIKKKDNKIENIKLLPHSLEAEQSILGSLILNNNNWDNIIERIDSNDFYSNQHKIIFDEMNFLLSKGQPLDLITLSESLKKKDKLNLIGGFAYLVELSQNTPNISNIIAYADIVHERAIIREMITAANEIANAGYYPKGRNYEELIDLAETKIFKIAEIRSKKNVGPQKIDEILDNTISRIELFYKNPNNGIIGIDTGYFDLNKKTGGLQKSDLIIIASRPSMGKTTFAMNLCENAAIIQKKPVLIFSLEMSGEQIMIRMISSLSRINQTKIRTGQLNDNEWVRISKIIGVLLENQNIYIDDSSCLTPSEIRTRSRRIFRENNGISLIMIDYLQLIRVPNLSNNRTLEISEISRSLKALAKELNVPILALSQLNRSLEQRTDKRPVNSDLRESGSIEQDADLILFVYRDEVYNKKSKFKDMAQIIIGKQRNGPIGSIFLNFNAKLARFDNYLKK